MNEAAVLERPVTVAEATEAERTSQRDGVIDRTLPDWYKDAIIYQLHIKAFYDANGDGIGDFAGLKQRLDYIESLGVNTIWLMPFYPSPLRDDGYDIADYRSINPSYGDMRDFRRFVRAAHRRGIRVVTELVINHTSDQHPWFQRARKAPPGSAARDYYVWSDTDDRYQGTRIIFLDTEKSNWTWDPVAHAFFWHRFYSHQPDLNFDNPRVMVEIIRLMHYWLDMGVDGLRLDAIPYLVEREGTNNENLPETHDVLKKIRAVLDANYPDRMLLAEANQWPEDTRPYFGDGEECQMAFHFPLMPRMYMGLAQEDRHPITDIIRQTPDIPDNCQWAIFLRNHDELTLEMVTAEERDYLWRTYARDSRARINLGIRRRLAPLMDNDRRKIELMNVLLLSMPGTPVLYYGDELGMGDNYYLGDRDGVRTPMQWSADRNGGFSRANPQALYLPPIMDPVYGFQAVNVEAQQSEPSSLLNWTRRIIGVRKQHKAFGRGTLTFLYPRNRKILAYLRRYEDEVHPLRGEPVASGPGGGARPFRMPRPGADRADRRRRLPADRRPAVHADAAGLRLLLVPARRRGGGAALAPAGARPAAGVSHAHRHRRAHRRRARRPREAAAGTRRAAGVPGAPALVRGQERRHPQGRRHPARGAVGCAAPPRHRGSRHRWRRAALSPALRHPLGRGEPALRRAKALLHARQSPPRAEARRAHRRRL